MLTEIVQRDAADTGRDLHALASRLYPICRSITGDGVRRTLAMIQEHIPLTLHEVSSGTEVFDWTIPKEWNIRDAWIRRADGTKVVDFQKCNLHVMSYSTPVRGAFTLDELRPHLFTIPDRAEWIPYRTSYYREDWGFCLSHNQLQSLKDETYEVCIDSTLQDGHLTYGEFYVAGRTSDEVLISCHVCHPSLANDNLSGLVVATALARRLAERVPRYSCRFLFIPGTIGAITWLSQNREAAARIRHGLVLTCVGDSGHFHYKRSRRGHAEIDRAMAQALKECGEPFELLDFTPYGYDERQYCSPGFNLPVGCLMRSVWGTFPEYHSSADNLDFIRPEALAASLRLCTATLEILENNRRYLSQNPWCEPQLGRRGLYTSVGGQPIGEAINARLWVLNFADGEHSLLDIAERSGISFGLLSDAANALSDAGLITALPAAA